VTITWTRYPPPWRPPAGHDDGRGKAAKAMEDAEIEDFIEGFKQPTYRGIADQRGADRYMVIPARVVWGRPARCGAEAIVVVLVFWIYAEGWCALWQSFLVTTSAV
jgi:hypothetical protein